MSNKLFLLRRKRARRLTITDTTGSSYEVNQSISGSISSDHGYPGYSYTLYEGSLPPGISLTDGTYSGTFTTPGTFDYTIKIQDSRKTVKFLHKTMVVTGQGQGPQQGFITTSPLILGLS